jgi:hypothetical protein
MNNDQPVLTGIGIRALVETVCKDRKTKGKNLAEQIDDLVTIGALPRERLSEILCSEPVG